eukprot:1005934-Lingulodinium_polyedra.AAC.1
MGELISRAEVFVLCCDIHTLSKVLGHAFHTAIILAPSNSDFCWARRLFNVGVSRATQLTIFIGDAGQA